MGEWDDMLKQLIKDHPQDFIALVLPKAQYVTRLPEELRSRRRHTDALCLTILNGQLMLVLFEFQHNNDYNMGERLLQYNVLASMNNDGLPIYSCVIWLRKDGNVLESPYIRRLPDGREAMRLYFESIKLWDMTAEELLEMDMPGLLPLVFLTRDGKRADVVE